MSTPLLTTQYWFALTPPPFLPIALIVLLAWFGALLAAGIVLLVLAWKKSDSMYWAKGARRFGKFFVWMAVLGFLFMGAGAEQAAFFSARFWYLLWGAVFLLGLAICLRYLLKVIPKQAAAFAEKARIEKYLPKRK